MNDICEAGLVNDFITEDVCKPIIEFSELPTFKNPFLFLNINLDNDRYALQYVEHLQWNKETSRECHFYDYHGSELCAENVIEECSEIFNELHPDNHHYSKKAAKGICNIVKGVFAAFNTKHPNDGGFRYGYLRIAHSDTTKFSFLPNLFLGAKRFINGIFGYGLEEIYTNDYALGWHVDIEHDEPPEYRSTLLLKGTQSTPFYKETYCQENGSTILSKVWWGIAIKEGDVISARLGQLGLFQGKCAIHAFPRDQKERLTLFINFGSK